ncbi:hypothetical protein TRFO_02253 [Tritrichomonas foetus]|uniref:VPS9 domain-containing protein n=1 Tax=Tritrichomonas foetus TaxID=1144522 RepID=A0A1J4J7Z1_9EUKA|nr:hypothetical protein TRFO_02253 [Tritrichomonas foetus]|eukprot:OHS95264.1 hypothetical protein TRFO_02253 [Tritrichomonas foetus]
MGILDVLIQCAGDRLFQIETELGLLKEQLSIIMQMPGANFIDAYILMLEYNINHVIHKYLNIYYNSLKENYKERCSLNDTINIHIQSMDKMSVSSFLFEISGHQNALADLTASSLFNNNGSPEGIIYAVKRFFPFDLILPQLQNFLFFSNFIKIIFEDKTKNYNKVVNNILSLFTFNDADKCVYIVISEVMLSYFCALLKGTKNDFELAEKFKILITKDLDLLPKKSINYKFFGINHEKQQNSNQSENNFETTNDLKNDIKNSGSTKDAPVFTVKHFQKVFTDRKLPFDNDLQENEIKCMKHVVLELQKLSIRNSYSMIAAILHQASDFMSRAVSAIEGNAPAGADETFQVLIYLICSAQISNIKTILNLTDSFCFSFIKESKVGYIIEQFKSVIDFISSIKLSPSDKIIVPFLSQQGAIKIDLNKFNVILDPNESIPVLFKYTGNDINKAIAYIQNYEMNEKELYNRKDIYLIQTMNGYLPLYTGDEDFHVVEDGDYEKFIASQI